MFSHNTLMLLNIILALIHIVLSSIFFYLYKTQAKIPSYAFPGFFVVSIVACLFILLFSYYCKKMYD
jgi:uncharacterized BrkB/YihY/UPF0761 family membrane protein